MTPPSTPPTTPATSDFIDTVPTNEIASLKDVNPEFHIIDALGTYYAAFNCKSALFADKTPEQAACMREAFSHPHRPRLHHRERSSVRPEAR